MEKGNYPLNQWMLNFFPNSFDPDKNGTKPELYSYISNDNLEWANGLIRYFDISFVIDPPVQICAFVCLRKLGRGYSSMVCPIAVVYYHATG